MHEMDWSGRPSKESSKGAQLLQGLKRFLKGGAQRSSGSLRRGSSSILASDPNCLSKAVSLPLDEVHGGRNCARSAHRHALSSALDSGNASDTNSCSGQVTCDTPTSPFQVRYAARHPGLSPQHGPSASCLSSSQQAAPRFASVSQVFMHSISDPQYGDFNSNLPSATPTDCMSTPSSCFSEFPSKRQPEEPSAPAQSMSAPVSNMSVGDTSTPARTASPPSPPPPPYQERSSPPCPPAAPAAGASPEAPGNTTLLTMSPTTPQAMRRRVWSLEDYDISKRVYKGSTSAVYKATCRRSGLPVALKVYFLSRVPSNVLHMVVREIKIHSELTHKNIVGLYAAFQDERRLVLVQEYAARGDLYGIHRAMSRRMTEQQLTELVLAPFLDALAYLHARGVCHRDIKPENVLFTADWRLVIADFGVSIDLNQERAVTRAGTLEYMAPEVERCPLKMLPEENKDQPSLAYGTAVDVWAVGVLAYELLVGFPPFVSADDTHGAGSGGRAFLSAHATRSALSFPASTSQAARDFITAALAERSEERPTAAQLLRHPWLMPAVARMSLDGSSPRCESRSPASRRSPAYLNIGVSPTAPSRLGLGGPAAALVAASAAAGAVGSFQPRA